MDNQVSLIERLRDITLSKGKEVYSSEDGAYREFKSGRITVKYYDDIHFASSSGALPIEASFPYSILVYRDRSFLPRVRLLEANGIKLLFSRDGWQKEVQKILENL